MKNVLKKSMGFVIGLVIVLSPMFLAACGRVISTRPNHTYALSEDWRPMRFTGDYEDYFTLPRIITNDWGNVRYRRPNELCNLCPDSICLECLYGDGCVIGYVWSPLYTVDWTIVSMQTRSGDIVANRVGWGEYELRDADNNIIARDADDDCLLWATVCGPDLMSRCNACAFCQTGQHSDDWRFTLRHLPEETNDTWASVVFEANINGSRDNVRRRFTVDLYDGDGGETTFVNLNSRNPQFHVGQANRRVFGLWDLTPAGALNAHLPASEAFEKSGDVINLTWRYRGDVALKVQVFNQQITCDTTMPFANNDPRLVGTLCTSDELTFQDDIIGIKADLRGGDVIRRLNVDFRGSLANDHTRHIRVFGTSVFDDITGEPQFQYSTAVFDYTYVIKDAVNAYNFDQIKVIEKRARLDYIINGVWYNGVQIIDGVGRGTNGVGGHYNYYNPQGNPRLLSSQFRTTRFDATGTREYLREAGDIFREFARWAPAFQYRHGDIVLRSNMYTWAEATWFFGNVHGNGFRLDATPYSQNSSGRYRNVHGNSWNHAHEGEVFRPGHGWGCKYAFYMLSNNSTIDNVHLVGENIRLPGGRVPLLNAYRTISVLGTSTLSGGAWGFNMGQAWDSRATNLGGGRFRPGMYVANIQVMNSIIEKGLILVGANYAPDRTRPIVVQSSILRYAGFAGIYGRGFDNSEAERRSHAGGVAITDHQIVERMGSDVRLRNSLGVIPGRQSGSYQTISAGNFVVAKNNLFYEICTSSIVGNDDFSGTHVRILGEDNHFYTWVDSLRIVFPIMKMPGGMSALDITAIAQREMTGIMNNPAYAPAKVRESDTSMSYHINLPFISVDTFDRFGTVANVVHVGNEVFAPHRNPEITGTCPHNFYMNVVAEANAGDAMGTVFAFTVKLVTGHAALRTGTLHEQLAAQRNISLLNDIIRSIPSAQFTNANFGF